MEKLYEIKNIEFLKAISQDKEAEKPFERLKYIEGMIDSTDSLLTWPFDYKQIITLIASALIPVLSFIITFLGGFITRV